ncbi:myb family transcription factor EFM-like [Impatiens glandulifera]|uniref:myb family transcription factor EFM-like n=1 Tax=Impatiens glandulifera TaxID=253017 RepID=UPI001FB16F55|nr:myb family transcription factor EFM-like [Impatiens glandulifera]
MMGSPSSELTLEFKPYTYSMLLKSFGEDQTGQNIEDFLTRLEEERQKIDAFKRELPLCMQLLTNAMEASKQQLQSYKATHVQKPAVLEEFIPIKNNNINKSSSELSLDKKNWMTSAQLWNGNVKQTTLKEDLNDVGFNVSPKQRKGGDRGGGFLPFSKEMSSNLPAAPPLPELALASVEMEEDQKWAISGGGNNVSGGGSTNNQTNRKARRCWSPDLHRRFVNALQMLGGSQVATPKQIRELMKVDGLTNDEVKSHLQKYRLHTRRPSHSPQTTSGQPTQLVVLGGIWVPPEYAAAAAHGASPHALYGSHPSAHYCGPPVGQEFYSTAAMPPPAVGAISHHQNHHQQLLHHHQIPIYKASSTNNSPNSDVRSESIEDGKSESSSGGDDGGERKGVAAMRGEGEERTGEIRLKF